MTISKDSDTNCTNEVGRLEGQWSRSWFLGRWQFESTKNWECASESLGSALDLLTKELIPQQLWNGEPIEDLAGVTNSESAENPICLSVQGKLKSGDNDWEEFSLKLETPFASFREPHHIRHSGKEFRTKNIPSFLKGHQVGRAIPLKIESFEISLSFYESKHTVFLGYNPTPVAEISIKASPQKIIAKLLVEQLGDNKNETLIKNLATQKFMRLDLSHLQS